MSICFAKTSTQKKISLLLYNALFDENLAGTALVKNLRLENTVYTGPINDVSFFVDDKIIVLVEHQSTINENMPRRFPKETLIKGLTPFNGVPSLFLNVQYKWL